MTKQTSFDDDEIEAKKYFFLFYLVLKHSSFF